MATLTPHQAADTLLAEGMPARRLVEFVAIAMAESSLDASAVSPAGAIGLWQIMPFNAPPFGFTARQLYEPAVNARVAVGLSGHGSNCAAWDTCYADIAASGRFSFLAFPQRGSAAWGNLTGASASIGRPVPVAAEVSAARAAADVSGEGKLTRAWKLLHDTTGPGGAAWARGIYGFAAKADTIATNGDMPL